MMAGDMRLSSKFSSEVMNSDLYTILSPPIWHCSMFAESNRNAPNSIKRKTISIAILLGTYFFYGMVVAQQICIVG